MTLSHRLDAFYLLIGAFVDIIIVGDVRVILQWADPSFFVLFQQHNTNYEKSEYQKSDPFTFGFNAYIKSDLILSECKLFISRPLMSLKYPLQCDTYRLERLVCGTIDQYHKKKEK